MLDSREFATSAVRALNYTAESTRTAAVKELQQRYSLAYQRFRREAFYMRKATRQTLTSIVGASGRPLRLYLFSARQNSAGVSVSVKKGKRKTIRHAFIARMKSGHVGVFTRDTKLRHLESRVSKYGRQTKHSEGIRELFTTSVPGMMQTREVESKLKTLAGRYFTKEFDRQVALMLRRRNG